MLGIHLFRLLAASGVTKDYSILHRSYLPLRTPARVHIHSCCYIHPRYICRMSDNKLSGKKRPLDTFFMAPIKRLSSIPAATTTTTTSASRKDSCVEEEESADGPTSSSGSRSTTNLATAYTSLPDIHHSHNSHECDIYCDLDGVLVDFDGGVRKLFRGQGPDSIPSGKMWAAISRADSFYQHLSWTVDGKELWEAIYKYSPNILTGVATYKKCRVEKFLWCQRELPHVDRIQHVDMAGEKSTHTLLTGTRIMRHSPRHDPVEAKSDHFTTSTPDTAPNIITVNVITCWSKNKHMESRRGAVLIDDRLDLKEAWESKGGIFIHHTNTVNTLAQLRLKKIIT